MEPRFARFARLPHHMRYWLCLYNVSVAGHVLLNEFWQAEMGDFTLDQKRFPTMKETINILQRRGFHLVVTIQPFISTESRNFAEAVKEGILVSARPRTNRKNDALRYDNNDVFVAG